MSDHRIPTLGFSFPAGTMQRIATWGYSFPGAIIGGIRRVVDSSLRVFTEDGTTGVRVVDVTLTSLAKDGERVEVA